MNPRTVAAVEAYQRYMHAQRRLGKAQSELHKAARLIPRAEWELYMIHINIERQESDRGEAADNEDYETVHAIDSILADLRKGLDDMGRLEKLAPPSPDVVSDPNLWHNYTGEKRFSHPRVACARNYCGLDPVSLTDTQAVIVAKMAGARVSDAELTVDEAAAEHIQAVLREDQRVERGD